METQPQAIIAQRFPKMVSPLVEGARHSICIIVFDWRWYPSVGGSSVSLFNAAIVAAAKRGVEVRALVNNDAVVERLRSHGIGAKRLQSKRMLHTKMMLIDDTKLVIGSHNYTQHGFNLNEEASIFVELPDVDNEFVQYFENLWSA